MRRKAARRCPTAARTSTTLSSSSILSFSGSRDLDPLSLFPSEGSLEFLSLDSLALLSGDLCLLLPLLSFLSLDLLLFRDLLLLLDGDFLLHLSLDLLRVRDRTSELPSDFPFSFPLPC